MRISIISPETYTVALKINEHRKERGKEPIKIVKVEHMKADNGKIISSTRIKAGEIDEHGLLLNEKCKMQNEKMEKFGIKKEALRTFKFMAVVRI